MKSYSFINFIKQYRWRYTAGIIWLILVDLLQLVIPWLLGSFTDAVKNGQLDRGMILHYVLLIIGLAVLTAFFRFLWRLFINGTSRLLEKNLREDFYQHLQTLSTSFYHNHKTGDLMAHATNDINAVRNAMGPGIVLAADSLCLTIATVIILLVRMDYRLTLLALVPLPFLSLITARFGRVIHHKFRHVQEAFSRMTDRVQENFSGIRVIKSFNQENAEIEKFSATNRHNYQMNIDLIKIWGMFWPLVQFISGLSFLVVLWYGGVMVVRGTISLGDFVAFNSYLALLTWPMMAIGFVVNLLQRGAASLDRLNGIFTEKPGVFDHSGTLNISQIKGSIEFRHLNFRYEPDQDYILKDINLTVQPGRTAAIIGRTGAGKTTLVNLILRLFNPQPGQLLIDGRDIYQIPLEVLRESIGYVPQDNFLFSSTISENIAFTAPDLPAAEIKRAARNAGVYDNIIQFPDGFDTILGERGVTLSGGQKQRISIARALSKDPDILILDDSLSAVDTRTEEEILQNLKRVTGETTTILISHRISTIKHADIIFVLEEGRIIEQGSHEHLLQRQGLYYQLYQKQLLEEKIASSGQGV